MKKMFIIIIMFLFVFAINGNADAKTVARERCLTVTQTKAGTKVKWNKKVIRWYDFHGKVKIVNGNQLTEKKLIRRKDKVLYIERIVGQVVNKRLDGRTSDGYYISYKSLKGKAHKGNLIITYCVYNPYTHWVDDIDERYDIIVR